MTEGEVVRLLGSEGRLGDIVDPTTVAIPQGVREVIGRRLEHVSSAANEVLVAASVVGWKSYYNHANTEKVNAYMRADPTSKNYPLTPAAMRYDETHSMPLVVGGAATPRSDRARPERPGARRDRERRPDGGPDRPVAR